MHKQNAQASSLPMAFYFISEKSEVYVRMTSKGFVTLLSNVYTSTYRWHMNAEDLADHTESADQLHGKKLKLYSCFDGFLIDFFWFFSTRLNEDQGDEVA